jgi:hypothetical protein
MVGSLRGGNSQAEAFSEARLLLSLLGDEIAGSFLVGGRRWGVQILNRVLQYLAWLGVGQMQMGRLEDVRLWNRNGGGWRNRISGMEGIGDGLGVQFHLDWSLGGILHRFQVEDLV